MVRLYSQSTLQVTDQSLPVILVGGGSVLLDSSRPFAGASSVSKPPHYGVRADKFTIVVSFLILCN